MSRLTENQQRLILNLGAPLPRPTRDEFFRRIGVELAHLPVIDDGLLWRLAASLQRSMLDPPILDGDRHGAWSKYR
jgi:hypothetical protein